MKRILCVLSVFLFSSCKSLPLIQPYPTSDNLHPKICAIPYLQGKWQFIHSIEATTPSQNKAFVMGITDISSHSRSISVVMMTLEGLVLFDAEFDKDLTIRKGIPPFDSAEFAMALIEDIQLIFLLPSGRVEQTGYVNDSSKICRYRDDQGFAVDVTIHPDNTWTIRKYDQGNRLIRMVNMVSTQHDRHQNLIPQTIELMAYGYHRYSLMLNLVKANQGND